MSSQNVTTITELFAYPANENEGRNSFRSVINALLGTWGNKAWDGGLDDANVVHGYWHRYARFWDCKLVFDSSGDTEIELPFLVKYGVARILDTSTETEAVRYIENSKSLTFSGVGRFIFSLDPVIFSRN